MSAGIVADQDGRRAVRLVRGAVISAVTAMVLLGLLTAALVRAADPGSGPNALGLALAAAGAVLCATGLLVVARAEALARRSRGVSRALTLLRRCVLAASVATVVVLVVAVVAMSTSAALPAALGGGGAILLLTVVGGLAAHAGRQLPDDEEELDDVPAELGPAQGASEPDLRRGAR